MNDYTLESFINFCDEMQIAEESLREINKLFNKELKAIEEIKRQIDISKGDYKKQIALYKKGCNILKSLKSKIAPMDETQFEKGTRHIKTILKVATIIASMVAVTDLAESPIAGMGAGILTGMGISKLGQLKKNKKIDKATINSEIDMCIQRFEVCIRTLNNPNVREKLSKMSPAKNNDTTNSILNNRVKLVADAAQPLINAIRNYIKTEIYNFTADATLNIETFKGYTNNVIPGYYFLLSITLSYEDFDYDKYYKIIESIEEKFKTQIEKIEKKYNCEIIIEYYSDDELDVNIEIHVN